MLSQLADKCFCINTCMRRARFVRTGHSQKYLTRFNDTYRAGWQPIGLSEIEILPISILEWKAAIFLSVQNLYFWKQPLFFIYQECFGQIMFQPMPWHVWKITAFSEKKLGKVCYTVNILWQIFLHRILHEKFPFRPTWSHSLTAFYLTLYSADPQLQF